MMQQWKKEIHGKKLKADERNKDVRYKIYALFISCKSEKNNLKIGNAKSIDIIMPMCNLIEHSDDYSKTSESLW